LLRCYGCTPLGRGCLSPTLCPSLRLSLCLTLRPRAGPQHFTLSAATFPGPDSGLWTLDSGPLSLVRVQIRLVRVMVRVATQKTQCLCGLVHWYGCTPLGGGSFLFCLCLHSRVNTCKRGQASASVGKRGQGSLFDHFPAESRQITVNYGKLR
jgi:hypothetical protein